MGIDRVNQIIYFLILLFILLIIIYPYLKSSYNSYKEKSTDEEELNEEDEDESTTNQEQLRYDKYVEYPNEFNLKLMNDDDSSYDENNHDSDFSYKDLLHVYHTSEFLSNYRSSLKLSFKEKLKKYKSMLTLLNRDIKSAESRHSDGNSILSPHDTSLERLRRSKSELSSIINIVEYRLNNNTIKSIKSNFDSMFYNTKRGFVSLIGRNDVKDALALQIYTFSQNPRIFFNNFQNIIITGKSGVGKTKLADAIGYIYSKSGIFARNKFRCVTKQDFTSPYVNEASQLARELLFSCLEGVIFIDEAYELIPQGNMFGAMHDHGNEALTEMVNFWDKNIGLSCTIMGGYKKEMQRILDANEGVDRRFPYKMHLASYSSSQLTDILLKFLHGSVPDIKVGQKDANSIYTILNYLYTENKVLFAKQAGDMLNLSSCIAKAMYGNTKRKWISESVNGRTKNNSKILLSGFNSYLRGKGSKLVL